MTDEQRRAHMKEIEEQLDKLRKERKEHEDYFFEKSKQDKRKEHRECIGKCYVSKELRENENSHVKAFKVLEVLEFPNENYARCLVLIDGIEKNCWNVQAIKIEVLGLWTPNISRLMYNESDPKVIDFYKEISQEEFESLYRDYNNRLDDTLFK